MRRAVHDLDHTNGRPQHQSSPYYYYDTDELWVGDDAGRMHKFTNIFSARTPVKSPGLAGYRGHFGRTLSAPVTKVANLVYVGSVRAPGHRRTHPDRRDSQWRQALHREQRDWRGSHQRTAR